MFGDTIGHEFRQGMAGMALLCSTTFGACGWKNLMTVGYIQLRVSLSIRLAPGVQCTEGWASWDRLY